MRIHGKNITMAGKWSQGYTFILANKNFREKLFWKTSKLMLHGTCFKNFFASTPMQTRQPYEIKPVFTPVAEPEFDSREGKIYNTYTCIYYTYVHVGINTHKITHWISKYLPKVL